VDEVRQEPARVATIDVAARAERPATEFERAKVWHETYQLVRSGQLKALRHAINSEMVEVHDTVEDTPESSH